jgi:hypothetical protein
MPRMRTVGGRGSRHPDRRVRRLVNALWTAAACAVLAGFVLRPLGRYLGGHDARQFGVALIALGLVIAGLGFLIERWAGIKPPPD